MTDDLRDRGDAESHLRGRVAELEAQVERYRELFSTAPVGLCEFDFATGKVVHANDALLEMVSLSPAEAGEFDGLSLVAEGPSRDLLRERLAARAAGEADAFTGEFEITSVGGRSLWVLLNSNVTFEGDKPVRATVVIHDITERKKMEDELSKVEKLESLGVLAGGIAHDFNNILTAILGNISVAKLRSVANPDLIRHHQAAEKACRRAQKLTHQLLTFSAGGVPVKHILSIAQLIEECAEFALRGSSVRCVVPPGRELWPTHVDEGQIGQVISNLVINASQAMVDGGEITIAAENLEVESGGDEPLVPGRYVHVVIADQGIGIAESHLAKIFDPFFTTKEDGSGLGLAVAFSIVKQHQGHLAVESELGRGTTFHLYLPASDGAVRPSAEVESVRGGEGRVLFMDDDEVVRTVGAKMLEAIGYQTTCAVDGAEALAAYADAIRRGEPFDFVVMDLTVRGGMGGREAMERLRAIDPAVKAIVSSGYSNDPVLADPEAYGFCGMVTKPFTVEQLDAAIASVRGLI
jgi:two-component system cell cycle sensor histidine kinase/response regulator CckA